MSIQKRLMKLLEERDIEYYIPPPHPYHDWTIMVEHEFEPKQLITPKTLLTDLWWLD